MNLLTPESIGTIIAIAVIAVWQWREKRKAQKDADAAHDAGQALVTNIESLRNDKDPTGKTPDVPTATVEDVVESMKLKKNLFLEQAASSALDRWVATADPKKTTPKQRKRRERVAFLAKLALWARKK